MKFNDEMIEKKTQEKLAESSFWREVYENAPDGAKRRLRIAFWASGGGLDEKEDRWVYREAREQTENEMSVEDFAYLEEKFPDGSGKTHYAEKRKEAEFKSLRTPEKLDPVIAYLSSGCTPYEKEMIAKTQEAFRHLDDPWPKYEWVWLAVGGNGDKCGLVGDVFDHGHGCERDPELAEFWFKHAAMSGDLDACWRLAHLYEREDYPCFSEEGTLFWIHEGIRRGDICSKVNLGGRLCLGQGWWTKHFNPEVGVGLLESSLHDDKSGNAYYYLGRCYEKGVGVEKSRIKAKRCMKKALEFEHDGALEAYERMQRGEWED